MTRMGDVGDNPTEYEVEPLPAPAEVPELEPVPA